MRINNLCAPRESELNREQNDVQEACQAMTAQRARVANREHVVRRLQARVSPSETNIDIQQAMLDAFNERAKQAINERESVDEETGTSPDENGSETPMLCL